MIFIDLQLGSSFCYSGMVLHTYDLCGVCNGDNSSVNVVTGSFHNLVTSVSVMYIYTSRFLFA